MSLPSVTRVLVCEGKDDLSALRAMVRHFVGPDGARSKDSGFEAFHDGLKLSVFWAQGKSALAERVVNLGSASERPDKVGVCFDPDRDSASQELDFFLGECKRLAPRSLGQTADGKRTIRVANREAVLLPAPWRSANPVPFDHMPQGDHCLERVLIAGILKAQVEGTIRSWADESTGALMKIVSDHGWKRAFRIWNAALQPKTESASFVDKLLQDQDTQGPCLSALLATKVGAVVEELLRRE